jgi:hypothetical protein
VARVIGVVVAALGQLQDAAAAHVGNLLDVGDFLLVPPDVVEHQPFAQREIAQRQLLGAQRCRIVSSSTAPPP